VSGVFQVLSERRPLTYLTRNPSSDIFCAIVRMCDYTESHKVKAQVNRDFYIG